MALLVTPATQRLLTAPALGMSYGGKIAILPGQAPAQKFSLPRRVGAVEPPSSSGTRNGIPICPPAFACRLRYRVPSEHNRGVWKSLGGHTFGASLQTPS
jgi:hypothetical protein